ncbi:MAG TPA: hypothetical protein VEU96_09755 [Bryobacteraceae bacterium]|nr:hypothetical protein [Bryobacteraceae bacterium]
MPPAFFGGRLLLDGICRAAQGSLVFTQPPAPPILTRDNPAVRKTLGLSAKVVSAREKGIGVSKLLNIGDRPGIRRQYPSQFNERVCSELALTARRLHFRRVLDEVNLTIGSFQH